MSSRLVLTTRGRWFVGLGVLLVLGSAAWAMTNAPGPAAPDRGEQSGTAEADETEAAPSPPPVRVDIAAAVPGDEPRLGDDLATASTAAVRALVERSSVLVVADESVLQQARGVAWRLDVPAVPASAPDLATLLDDIDTELVVHVTAADAGGAATDEPTSSSPEGRTPDVGDREVRTVTVDGTTVDRSALSDLRPDVEPPGSEALVLVPEDDPARDLVATVTRATGAQLVPVAGGLVDSPAAIRVLQARGEAPWVAVGTSETWSGRSPDLLAWDVPVVRGGTELPGGGYRLFPGRRLVALYGSPGTSALGVLGEQPLDAAIDRARDQAAAYDDLVDEPVVPTFEIIATVASADSGADGTYSRPVPLDRIRPWVEQTADEGVYVILDLQPGRTDFLTQARALEELLVHPHVGLALDPEWRLRPDQRHLEQIGSVEVDEVQEVADWLADLTRREGLPQKLLLLHQFRLSMLPDLDELTLPPELAVTVQMDGQGPQEVKMATWRSVTNSPTPEGLWFGWKNFHDEDTTLRSPEDTLDVEPSPVLVSYQ